MPPVCITLSSIPADQVCTNPHTVLSDLRNACDGHQQGRLEPGQRKIFCLPCTTGYDHSVTGSEYLQPGNVQGRTLQDLNLWSLEAKFFDGKALPPPYKAPVYRGPEPTAKIEGGKICTQVDLFVPHQYRNFGSKLTGINSYVTKTTAAVTAATSRLRSKSRSRSRSGLKLPRRRISWTATAVYAQG